MIHTNMWLNYVSVSSCLPLSVVYTLFIKWSQLCNMWLRKTALGEGATEKCYFSPQGQTWNWKTWSGDDTCYAVDGFALSSGRATINRWRSLDVNPALLRCRQSCSNQRGYRQRNIVGRQRKSVIDTINWSCTAISRWFLDKRAIVQ